jgi:hypothetical protein
MSHFIPGYAMLCYVMYLYLPFPYSAEEVEVASFGFLIVLNPRVPLLHSVKWLIITILVQTCRSYINYIQLTKTHIRMKRKWIIHGKIGIYS